MRTYDPAEFAHLQSRSGTRARLLVWIAARNRLTDAVETVGFWNGDDDVTFTIEGEARVYHGAGALLGMDDLNVEPGLGVRMFSVWLATAAPEVIDAVRGYDVRLAPVEVHRVLTDPVSHQMIAPPHRLFRGTVDGAPLTTPAKRSSGGRVAVSIASAARALTRTLSARYSDASMRRRGGDDRLFRYADVSGSVPVYWGEKAYTAPAPKVAVAPKSWGNAGDNR
jgi:hypothetical protein